jgi:ABC-type phosphate/phosphonate transport system ATPase subunit
VLCGVAERHGVALLCSLHQPELAARFFGRVLNFKKGGAAEPAPMAMASYAPAALPAQ